MSKATIPGARVSIRELAHQLGLSTATVSQVLNDVPDSRIRTETATRVRELAERLHYVPSAAGRQLRRRRAEAIGVIVLNLGQFSVGIIEAIERRALERGYTAILACSGENASLERHHLELALSSKVDGLIVIPSQLNRNQDLYTALFEQDIPVVFVDRYLPGVPADYIGVENERGAYLATRHLIAIGARQIGVVSPGSRDTPQRERLDGYQRAVAEAGLPTIDLGKNTQPRDFHRVLTQADPPLEAIFWGSYNYLHRRFVTMLREGLDPPTNLLFAGFDSLVITASSAEEYQVAQLLVRPLPTVIQPHGELGRRAVDQLLTRLEGDRSEHVHLRLPLAYFGIEP